MTAYTKWVMLLQYLVLYGLVESIVGAVAFFVAGTALSNAQVGSLSHIIIAMTTFRHNGCCSDLLHGDLVHSLQCNLYCGCST